MKITLGIALRGLGLVKSHPETDYATTLRAIAAVMVFSLHGNFFAPIIELTRDIGFGSYQIENLANLGGAGPAAFFMASGFVLSIVWNNSKSQGFWIFAFRRYVRLMPLYFVVLSIFSLIALSNGAQVSNTLQDLMLRALFIDVFSEEYFDSLPMAVLWTVGVEFWLSLLIPALVSLFNRQRISEVVLFLTLLISFGLPIIFVKFGASEQMAYKSVPACLASFALGVFVSTLKPSSEVNRVFKLFSHVCAIFLIMYLWSGFMGAWWVTILTSLCYLGLRRTAIKEVAQSDFLLWLGTVCYGIYLLHIPLIELMSSFSQDYAAVLAFLPLLVLSSLSWLFIERPLITAFNMKLNASRKSRR